MRRLKSSYDSLMGGDAPGGSWYNRTPDIYIHEEDTDKNIVDFKKRKRTKEKNLRQKEKAKQSEQEAIDNTGRNSKLNQRNTGNAGDSNQKITNTLPMGWNSFIGPGHGYHQGNTDANRAGQWNMLAADSNKRLRRYSSSYQHLADKWTDIIMNPKDPTAFVYMQLAYLIQEIMYDVTELVVHKQLPSKPIVVFVQDWLNNNPIARQCVRYCGSDFSESNTYTGLIRGLYNLRDMLASIEEYDHSFNIKLRNQRTFY